jgi:hypothetical protein
VLLVGADYTGNLGVADEVQKLRAIAARNRQQIRLSVLLDATAAQLLEAVRGREYHVLHFIGHGLPVDAAGEARDALVLMPEDRKRAADGTFRPSQVVKAEELCGAVEDNGGVRLVILDACNTDEIAARLAGAEAGEEQKTVQGAVGVRGSISLAACAAFATELYRAIVRGAPLDTAVTIARRQVDQRLTGSREWGLQTFYLQTPDGEFALWPVQELLGTGEWATERTGDRESRRKALTRVICELNQRALEDLIERCDGRAPQVVHDQLKAVKARLKSL